MATKTRATGTRSILITLMLVLGQAGLAGAQQASPPPPTDTSPPIPKSDSGPTAAQPSAKAPAVKPSEAPAEGTEQGLVGLDVFSSDGTRVGDVRAVNMAPGGTIVALHVRTGGFLGFGGRLVAIPEGRFTRSGQSIRLDLDSDQVSNLPDVKE